jgi:signal transduction histidine kinase
VVDQAAEMQRLRELVHELRTPLNAITGFGDMIRHQFLGPVAQAYRDQAGTIVDAAAEITQIIDDLALFVRGNDAVPGVTQPVPDATVDQGVDGVAVLHRVLTAHRDQAEALNLHLQVQTGRAVPPLAMGEQVLERMMSRLLGNVLALCGQGEAVSVDYLNLPSADGCACLSVSRPGQLLGIPAEALFDPDRGTEELAIDGPRLSLGFTLHLLRNLARQYHGDLEVAEHDIVLVLPMIQREDLIRTP